MPNPRSKRTTVRRGPDRAHYDHEQIHAILDEARVCHVAFVHDDHPCVVPTLHVRVGETLYLHGSPASRLIRSVTGGRACIEVTLVDGLVLARSAFHHSMNYRSVVVYGAGTAVSDRGAKLAILEALVEKTIPGRWDGCRRPSEDELRKTAVVGIPLDEASAKIRTGPPVDEEDDYGLPHWAGTIPLRTVFGAPVPDTEAELPDHLRRFLAE